MKKRNLQQWMNICCENRSDAKFLFGRYVHLTPADILDFTWEEETMPPESEYQITVLEELDRELDRVYDENDYLREKYDTLEVPPVIYEYVMKPFEGWLLRTEYQPDMEFLATSGIVDLYLRKGKS